MLLQRLFTCSNLMMAMLLWCLMGPSYAVGQNQQADIHFNELIEFAHLANASYLPEAEIAELLTARNYKLTLYRSLADTNLVYFVATHEPSKTQLVSIRGTSNVENTILDISVKLMPDQITGLRLHEGFSVAARQLYADLKPLLKKDYQINATGHSLGGAVALILAMYLDAEHFTVGQVITFGQPKVTNVAGAKHVKDLKVTRVVTPLDLVPLMPPFDPLDINNLDIYWHAGKEVLLLDDTRYSELEGLNSMLRATKFTQQLLNEENLKNHQMSVYISKLNEKKETSERVPYKNSFNLFNLFGG